MIQNYISNIKLNRVYDLFGKLKVIEKNLGFWGAWRIIYVRYVNWLTSLRKGGLGKQTSPRHFQNSSKKIISHRFRVIKV